MEGHNGDQTSTLSPSNFASSPFNFLVLLPISGLLNLVSSALPTSFKAMGAKPASHCLFSLLSISNAYGVYRNYFCQSCSNSDCLQQNENHFGHFFSVSCSTASSTPYTRMLTIFQMPIQASLCFCSYVLSQSFIHCF